jgi:hypothetical protein
MRALAESISPKRRSSYQVKFTFMDTTSSQASWIGFSLRRLDLLKSSNSSPKTRLTIPAKIKVTGSKKQWRMFLTLRLRLKHHSCFLGRGCPRDLILVQNTHLPSHVDEPSLGSMSISSKASQHEGLAPWAMVLDNRYLLSHGTSVLCRR